MAIITGAKVRKELSARKENAVEGLSQIVLMSSGIKLRRKGAETIGVVAGDHVSYFIDDETNQLYLAKVDATADEKSKVSKINSFTNKGLIEQFHLLSGVDTTEFVEGDQLVFDIATKAVDKKYFN